MNVTLVMFSPAGERREFKLPHAKSVIGRNSDTDLQVELPIVSRRHCELTIIDDEELIVRDLGSSNGTFVNGQRIQQTALKPGDTLTIGPVVFTVVIDGNPAEVAPIKTVLNGAKKKKKAPLPTPKPTSAASSIAAAQKANADSGSIDLTGSTGINMLDDDADDSDSSGTHNPLAALEELSKQHKR